MKLKSIRVDALIYATAKERLAAAGWNDVECQAAREDTRRTKKRTRAERARLGVGVCALVGVMPIVI